MQILGAYLDLMLRTIIVQWAASWTWPKFYLWVLIVQYCKFTNPMRSSFGFCSDESVRIPNRCRFSEILQSNSRRRHPNETIQ